MPNGVAHDPHCFSYSSVWWKGPGHLTHRSQSLWLLWKGVALPTYQYSDHHTCAIMKQKCNMAARFFDSTKLAAVQLGPHCYWFHQPPAHLKIICDNGTHYIHHTPAHKVEVPSGCEAPTDSIRISKLTSSHWMTQDNVDPIPDEIVMTLHQEQMDCDTTKDNYQHAQTAAIFACLVLFDSCCSSPTYCISAPPSTFCMASSWM